MSKTRIQDVIVPEVFANYVIQYTKELSEIVSSGIAQGSPELDSFVKAGGKLINMPFWKPLGGTDEVLSDSEALTPDKITAGGDVAAMLIRAKAWSTNELAGALAGDSPMKAIASQVAGWWVRKEQSVLISTLRGIFATALAGSHVNATTTRISANGVLDTKQLLGDAADQFSAMAVHSATFTALQKQNLITYIPNSRGEVTIPTYLGYRVIVDDACPRNGNNFTTYLFAAGSFARGEGVPTDITPVETDRDSLASDDILINRRAYVLHPVGVKFTNQRVSGATPTNAELADATNWQRVYETKAIGLAEYRHTL